MAEQKIDDTKVPAARRGARPFAGPTGATPAARPFLRPAAPAAGPSHARFAPPSIGRPALGTKAPGIHLVGTAQAVQDNAVPTQAAAFEPAPEPASPSLQPTIETHSIVPGNVTRAEGIAPEVVAESVIAERRRPVTSEMVALDAFDAFEATWTGVDASEGPTLQAPPSPLDELALGTESGEGDYAWTHDFAAPDAVTPAGDVVDAGSAGSADIDGGWPTADIGMPAWLADDSHAANEGATAAEADADWSDAPSIPSADDVIASSAPEVASLGDSEPHPDAATPVTPFTTAVVETESWPDPLLAEYAPYVSVARETPAYLAIVPQTVSAVLAVSSVPTSGASTNHETPSVQEPASAAVERLEPAAAADPRVAAAARISATLDRLAERVRDGEIDVSSVAPDATDAAVLASVLAALLGGSSRR